MHGIWTRRFTLITGFALALMAGCGGGGGGGAGVDNGGGGTPGLPPQLESSTGLIPAAPNLGEVLQAEALTLRPFVEGASWHYRGAQTRSGNITRYETVTTQSAVTSQSASERGSNPANGGAAETSQVQREGGEVFGHVDLDLTGKGAPGRLRVVELRSPVRTGDQVVLLDRRYTDTNLDVDRDGRTDALDFAAYTRVVGLETVVLPNLGSFQAVRVDLVIHARVRPSSQSAPLPVIESRLSNYYVAGIGLVRSVSATTSSTSDSDSTDELLVSWNGINAGLGAMPPVAAVIPPTNGLFPGQSLSANSFDVVVASFDNHALVVTPAPGSFGDSLVSKVDRQGRVLAARLLPFFMHSSRPALVHPGGIVFMEQDPAGDPHTYVLTRVDNEGQLQGTVRGVAINLIGNHAVNSSASAKAAVSSDGTLWVLASRQFRDLTPQGGLGNSAEESVLLRYSLAGERLGSEVVLPALAGGLDARLVATPAELLITMRQGSEGRDLVVARVNAQGGLTVRTVVASLPGINTFVTPFQLAGRQALLWPAELGSGRNLGATGGVLLAGDLAPVRAGSTWLDEQLPWMPQPVPFSSALLSVGSRLAAVGQTIGRLWAEDSNDSLVDAVGWIDVLDDTALALKPARSVRFATEGRMVGQALFDDRVLVFGESASGLTTRVVWMPRASVNGS